MDLRVWGLGFKAQVDVGYIISPVDLQVKSRLDGILFFQIYMCSYCWVSAAIFMRELNLALPTH